jgi:hypothetical protein
MQITRTSPPNPKPTASFSNVWKAECKQKVAKCFLLQWESVRNGVNLKGFGAFFVPLFFLFHQVAHFA